ncbi:MAG: CBS domain-containing protein [Candidatus Kariarchaeaceae archaeon]|jgi:CBS domain-containing protein
MEDPLVTIDQNKGIGMAAQEMVIKGFRRLAVTDDDGKIVGVITVRDVVLGIHESFLALFNA